MTAQAGHLHMRYVLPVHHGGSLIIVNGQYGAHLRIIHLRKVDVMPANSNEIGGRVQADDLIGKVRHLRPDRPKTHAALIIKLDHSMGAVHLFRGETTWLMQITDRPDRFAFCPMAAIYPHRTYSKSLQDFLISIISMTVANDILATCSETVSNCRSSVPSA